MEPECYCTRPRIAAFTVNNNGSDFVRQAFDERANHVRVPGGEHMSEVFRCLSGQVRFQEIHVSEAQTQHVVDAVEIGCRAFRSGDGDDGHRRQTGQSFRFATARIPDVRGPLVTDAAYKQRPEGVASYHFPGG